MIGGLAALSLGRLFNTGHVAHTGVRGRIRAACISAEVEKLKML